MKRHVATILFITAAILSWYFEKYYLGLFYVFLATLADLKADLLKEIQDSKPTKELHIHGEVYIKGGIKLTGNVYCYGTMCMVKESDVPEGIDVLELEP